MRGIKSTLAEMQDLARKKGGRCLSSTYKGIHVKLKWSCAKDHKWEARPSSIKSMGSWCPRCSGKCLRSSIEEMQVLAKKYNGKCLSSSYIDSHTKLRWQCAQGHEWESTPTNIKNFGHWCPICRKESKKRL